MLLNVYKYPCTTVFYGRNRDYLCLIHVPLDKMAENTDDAFKWNIGNDFF